MKEIYSSLGYTDLILRTDSYFKKHFLLILILGLVAGTGRFIQEGGSGEISSSTHAILEVVVNGARLLIIWVVIGQGYIQAGFRNFINIFRLTRNRWHTVWANAKANFSNNFPAVLVNFIIYIVIAVIINIALFALFEYTSLLVWLKSGSLINLTASKWPVLLFLKNISIIPYTLVFETVFVMWIVERNKLIAQ
jgi:hypothetical protein